VVLLILIGIVAFLMKGSGKKPSSSKDKPPVDDDDEENAKVPATDEEAAPLCHHKYPTPGIAKVTVTIGCVAIMLIASILGPASDLFVVAQSKYPVDTNRIADEVPQKVMIWYPYYTLDAPRRIESPLTLSSTLTSGGSGTTSTKFFTSASALKQAVNMPYAAESIRFWMAHDAKTDPKTKANNFLVHLTDSQSGQTEFFWGKCNNASAAGWCEASLASSSLANINGGGNYLVELTPPFNTADTGTTSTTPTANNVLYMVTPKMSITPATMVLQANQLPDKKFTYELVPKSGGGNYYNKWQTYAYNKTTKKVDMKALDESVYYGSPASWNMKMELYIRATLFQQGSVDKPAYPAYKASDVTGTFAMFNPFRDQTNFTVRLGVMAPNGTEYKIMDSSISVPFQQAYNLNYTFHADQGIAVGNYNVVGGVYYTNKTGQRVMFDKWGDTTDEFKATQFVMVNETPIKDWSAVEEIASGMTSGNIPVYHIRCEDAPNRFDTIEGLGIDWVQIMIDQFSELENKYGVTFQHVNITSTRQLNEVVSSDVSNGIIINYHRDFLPIPQAFVRSGDLVYQDSVALYRFDDGNGSRASDSSIYISPATLVGGATWTGDSAKGPSAVRLDGKNGYVSVRNKDSYNMTTFTLDFYVNITNDISSGTHTLLNYLNGTSGYAIQINQTGASSPNTLQAVLGTGKKVITMSGGALTKGTWHRITMTFDTSTGAELYVDKVRKATTTATGNLSFDQKVPMTLGGKPSVTESFTAMSVDELRITNDRRVPSDFTNGSELDAMNWFKRVAQWVADKGMVLVNQQWAPFSVVGNTEMNWPDDTYVVGKDGIESILGTRSMSSNINYQTGMYYIHDVALTPEAKAIKTDTGLDFTDPAADTSDKMIRMTLQKEWAQYSVPIHTLNSVPSGSPFAKGDILSALVFYGKGAILFNGLEQDYADPSTIAGVSGWFIAKHVRPAYIIASADSPYSSDTLSKSGVTDIKKALTDLGANARVTYNPITIGTNAELERLLSTNIKDTLIINAHGEVLPVPKSYVTGVDKDETTVALYNFEDISGQILHDESGHRIDGRLNNVTILTDSYFGRNAVSFNGKTSYIEISKNPKMVPTQNSPKFTLDLSIYLNQDYTDATKRASIVSGEYSTGTADGTQTYGYSVKVTKNGTLQNSVCVNLGSAHNDWKTLCSNVSLKSKTWYRLAVVYDGAKVYIYLNYKLANSMAVSNADVRLAQNLRIGQSSLYPGEYLNAILDNVRISSGAKSIAQLQLDTIAHGEYLADLSNWLSANGNVWTNLGGYDFYYLGLTGEMWPNNLTVISNLGLREFLAASLPETDLIDKSDAGKLTDIGKIINTDLSSAGLTAKDPLTSTRNLPTNYDLFTIPVFSSTNSIQFGAIYVGKGFLIHYGPFYTSGSAHIPLSVSVWLMEKSKVQMVYLINVPPSKAYMEPLSVESPHAYSNNLLKNYTIQKTGQVRIRAHFDKMFFNDNNDLIKILDGNGLTVTTYTGRQFDVWTPWIEGDKLTVSLVTDASGVDWGFNIDKYEYMTPVTDASGYTAVGQKEVMDKYKALEVNAGKQDLFIPINSSIDFTRLLSGRVEKPVIINLHGSSFPIPNEGANTAAPAADASTPSGYKQGGLTMKLYQDPYYDISPAKWFNTLKVTKVAPNVFYDWGYGQPDPVVNADYFSTNFSGMIKVDKEADYYFGLTTDDGSKLYIDGSLVINAWYLQCPTFHASAKVHLAAGYHVISYEHYERYGYATAKLYWSTDGSSWVAVPSDHLYYSGVAGSAPEGYVGGGLIGEYFDDVALTQTRFARMDPAIDFTFNAAPGPYLSGNIGIRWSGLVKIDAAGSYTFSFDGAAGAKVYLGTPMSEDPKLILTTTAGAGGSSTAQSLSAGYYELKVEYMGTIGSASAKLSWSGPSIGKTTIPSDHLYFFDAMKSTEKWTKAFGRWVSENGATYANAVDYPFQYAIIDGYGKFPLGTEGFNEFLEPRVRPIEFSVGNNATAKGTLTSIGEAIAAELPSGSLTSFITNISAPLPPDANCIPLYVDQGDGAITHCIMPYGRGGYIHSGGFSVDALVVMTYMYASQRDRVEFLGHDYIKGDSIVYKLDLKNGNPTSIGYLFYLSLFTQNNGDKMQRIMDVQVFTMGVGEVKTIYLTWTPLQSELPTTYTMNIVAIDAEDQVLMQQIGYSNESIAVNVRIAAYISGLWTDETVGYFDPVDFKVSVTNEMYIDEDFTISGMFINDKKGYAYWTDKNVDFTSPSNWASTWRTYTLRTKRPPILQA
jgi:hypothetical protein